MNIEWQPEPGQSEASDLRALWLAVLERMFLDAYGRTSFHGGALPTPIEQRQARNWMRSKSFDDVCLLAGVEPEFARRLHGVAKRRLLEKQRRHPKK